MKSNPMNAIPGVSAIKVKLAAVFPALSRGNIKLLVSALLCGVVLAAGATAPAALQNLESRRDKEKVTASVMRSVSAGEMEQAYAELKKNVSLPPEDIEAGLRASMAQRNALFDQRYGLPVGYELISSKKLGDSLWRFTYLEQRQRQPLVWTFQFYSNGEGWVMNEFSWSPQTAALFLQN